MITEKEIYEIIEIDRLPVWTLEVKQSYDFVNAGKETEESLKSYSSENEKIERSKQSLSNRLSFFPDNYTFKILLKNSDNTSRGKVAGPFEFKKSNYTENKTLGSLPEQNINKEIISEKENIFNEKFKYLEDKLRAENEINLERWKLAQEKKDFDRLYNEKLKDLEREKDSKLTELEQLKEQTDSKLNLLVNGITLAGKYFVSEYPASPIAHLLSGVVENAGKVKDLKEGEQNVKPEEKEKQTIIEDFATEIFESKLTTEEVKNFINRYKNDFHKKTGKTESGDKPENE